LFGLFRGAGFEVVIIFAWHVEHSAKVKNPAMKEFEKKIFNYILEHKSIVMVLAFFFLALILYSQE
jgi:hypothetical protein